MTRQGVRQGVEQEHSIPLGRREFERALDELTRAFERSEDNNPDSYRSENCERCVRCMFTTDSVDCTGCTYCHRCTDCTSCTHCSDCRDCHASSYCRQAHHCTDCSYVVRSSHMKGCVFCFGCVGLVDREFHILNRPFPRKVYFELVAELEEALGM